MQEELIAGGDLRPSVTWRARTPDRQRPNASTSDAQRRADLAAAGTRRQQVHALPWLSRAPLVERWVKRLPLARCVLPMRVVVPGHEKRSRRGSRRAATRPGEQRVEAIEREAGQAALPARSR